MKVTDLLQYPIKGLNPETLDRVELTIGAGMPADRLFAITHGNTMFNFENPAWTARKNFTVVAHTPQIGPIDCQFNHTEQSLMLMHNSEVLLKASVEDADINEKLTLALTRIISDGQAGPYKLVRAGNTRLTDIPSPTISIMSNKSLEALEYATGESLDKRRFRGNLWFDGDKAWQEHDWVGKQIKIGNVKLYVTERIQRCAAIDADPTLGVRNIKLLKQLNQYFQHTDFGVLAQVDVAGTISTGDNFQL